MDNFSGAEAVFDSVAPEVLQRVLKFAETLSDNQAAEFRRIVSMAVEAGQAWEADVYASQGEDY